MLTPIYIIIYNYVYFTYQRKKKKKKGWEKICKYSKHTETIGLLCKTDNCMAQQNKFAKGSTRQPHFNGTAYP